MTHDEMIAVLQAAKEGKRIETRGVESSKGEWEPCRNPAWNFGTWDYRVATDPFEQEWSKWTPLPNPNYKLNPVSFGPGVHIDDARALFNAGVASVKGGQS